MSDDPIAILLDEEVLGDHPSSAWPYAVLAGFLAIGGLATWWLLAGGDADATLPLPTTISTQSPTTVAVPEPVVLTEYVTDPQILDLPTILPGGWERCGASVLCDPGDPRRAIDVRDLTTVPAASLATGLPGLVFTSSAVAEVAIALPSAPGVAYAASGLNRDDLLTVVASVPLASDDSIVIPEEAPLAERPDKDAVAALLGVEREVVEGQFFFDVPTLGVSFQFADVESDLSGPPGARLDVRATALRLGDPISVSAERTLVVGSGDGGSVAVWVQRGYRWHVAATTSVELLAGRVLDLEARISRLP